ncbi:MAG TPA: thioredoxin domain-containing protein [Gammaproteobacteria bacterium]|nr:thioredoxin domain-containing protein [Gammaproteobacteria bacterium]
MSSLNKLANETSPYLLQHADNPVDWYPWGSESLTIARQQNKPILLSIGYSACHWCHVMAHESFEDETTASIMNERFINIKVDREERPDLDRIYQRAHQLLTQRPGGWPLTMFLMPDDHVPFFAGTYFPNEPRYQLPSFSDLLCRIDDFYKENRSQLEEQNQSLMQSLQNLQPEKNTGNPSLNPAPLDMSRKQLENSMDWKHGGFGQAPKFPHPTNIERLLRHWAGAREDTRALQMACLSLKQMAQGGLNDQLGGGFCRYSVDDRWMIPHFEKMLYDNGPLLTLYSEAWAATGEPLFLDVVNTTTEWVMREMQSPGGGYYSSLDADSEGEEGKFYAWERDEIHGLLETDEFTLFELRYGLNRKPNFEGKYYPHVFMEWGEMARQTGKNEQELTTMVKQAREKLFCHREKRIHPGRDDKILTSWNALMIKGMASAARHLDRTDVANSAFRALDFIRTTLWQGDRLMATVKDGKAHLNAYLDDYVFLIDAIIELSQVRWRDGDLTFAIQLADVVLEQFEDKQNGGFFFTSNDHEQLIERPKPYGDDATPSGNGIAAFALQRLGHIIGDSRYTEAAEKTLHSAWESIRQIPYAHNSMLLALEEHLYPAQIIILRGQVQAMEAWKQQCIRAYAPRRITLAIPAECNDLPGILASNRHNGAKVVATVCNGAQCQAPIGSVEALEKELAQDNARASIHWE